MSDREVALAINPARSSTDQPPAQPSVQGFESLALMRASAPSMRDDSLGADLFFTLAWFDNLASHGLDAQWKPLWLLLHATSGEACLPMAWQPRAAVAVFGPVLSSMANYYASLYGPVSEGDGPSLEACLALVHHLRLTPLRCGVVNFHPLDADGHFFRRLQHALRAQGWWTDTYFCFGNWHLRVDGRSFEQYFPTVPSRIRNTIRRGRKKLDEAGAWSLHIESVPGPALEQAISDFEAIYRKSWKVPEPFPQFVPGLCRSAAGHGWLRLGVVRLGPTPIAAQLWLIRDGKAQIYKLAYDEEFKRFSAGSVLTAEMMRQAIDIDRADDIDYLTGDDDYKADWMSHRRERVGIVAFDPRTLQGLASALRHRGGRWLQRLRARLAPGAPTVMAPVTAPGTPTGAAP